MGGDNLLLENIFIDVFSRCVFAQEFYLMCTHENKNVSTSGTETRTAKMRKFK